MTAEQAELLVQMVGQSYQCMVGTVVLAAYTCCLASLYIVWRWLDGG